VSRSRPLLTTSALYYVRPPGPRLLPLSPQPCERCAPVAQVADVDPEIADAVTLLAGTTRLGELLG
jgi:hypothetical protein